MHLHRTVPTVLLVLVLAGVVAFTSGCPRSAPGSQAYRPLPQWEAKFFKQAKRDVFPNDVRQHPDAFTNTLVAWTGVITNIAFFNDGSSRVARVTAEHHYFDWIEDKSIQRERFFLSPRGEGAFAAAWRAGTPDEQKFLGQFAVGDMLIAYGHPSLIRSNVVGLYPTQNLRAIKPQWYRTDILDYGRPGEPSKILKTAW
ncbi:MAG: hypothetical protein K0Q55_2750 [Verrucomicrobia bacterium]|nr:hypothetical protein [Verrucomicrobiota bacterium]